MKRLIVLGRLISQKECKDIITSLSDEESFVCDFSDYYFANWDFALSKGRIGNLIQISEIFHQNEERLKPKYLDSIANWPEQKLPNGKNLKESLVWRDISLWWFTEPARKAVGEYAEFTRLCEIFTIKQLIQEYEITEIWLYRCPKAFAKILKKYSKKIRVFNEIIEDNIAKWFTYRIRLFLSACLKKFLLKNLNSKKAQAQKYQLISLFPFNWEGNSLKPVDRMYHELVDKENLQLNWCLIYTGRIRGFFSFRKNIEERINAIKTYYTKATVSFVESHICLRDIFFNFIDLLPFLKYIFYIKSFELKKLMKIDDVDVFPLFSGILLKSFIINVYQAQLLSSSFYRYAKNNQNVYISYGEFFPLGRAFIHGIKKSDSGSKVIWHQHALHSVNKLILINRPNEVNISGENKFISGFPIADRYLMWGKKSRERISSFFPRERITLIGSYKYANFENYIDYPIKREDSRKIRILICPSNTRAECLFLFYMVASSLKGIEDKYEVIAIKHPVLYREQFIKDLKDYGCSSAKFFEGATLEIVKNADIVIVGVSSIVIDAILLNKPFFVCKPPNDIYYGIEPEEGINIVDNIDALKEGILKYSVNRTKIKNFRLVSEFLEYTEAIKERFWNEVKKG